MDELEGPIRRGEAPVVLSDDVTVGSEVGGAGTLPVISDIAAGVAAPALSPLARYMDGREAITMITDILYHLTLRGRQYPIADLLGRVRVSNLDDLIELVGGKNFGEMVAQVFYGERALEVNHILGEGGLTLSRSNKPFYIGTGLCSGIEDKIGEFFDEFYSILKKKKQNNWYDLLFLRRDVVDEYIMSVLPNFLDWEVLRDLYKNLCEAFPDGDCEGNYILRGSLKSEDWFDTALAGVSPSLSAILRLVGEGEVDYEECYKSFVAQLLRPYVIFFYHKSLARFARSEGEEDGALSDYERDVSRYSRFDLAEDEKLGLQVVPKIDICRHVVAVVHGDSDDVELEITCPVNGYLELASRVRVDADWNIEVEHGFDYEVAARRHGVTFGSMFHAIGDEKSFLSAGWILAIAALMREKRDFFGFSVDSEFGIDEKGCIYDFQTRVAGSISGEVIEEPELDGWRKVMSSNFNLGSRFKAQGKFLHIPNVKAAAIVCFKEILDAIMNDGLDPSNYILVVEGPIANALPFLMRLYSELDGMCFAGVINVSSGTSLTHSRTGEGGTYFLRENYPCCGKGEGSDQLLGMEGFQKVDVSKSPKGFFVSDFEGMMICEDGKKTTVYILEE